MSKKYYYSLKLREGCRSFISRERPVHLALLDDVSSQIWDLVDKGVLRETRQADWVSPVVVVNKSNDKQRIYGDFRELNKNLVDNKYLLPGIDDLLARLGEGNKWFAKIDLEAAYHQILLEKNSQPLTTVITHVGTFKYTVMPFGLKTAPSAFQRVMADVLMGCEGTLCYLDDILVVAKDQETLRQRVNGVKKRLDGVGIRSN